MIRNTIALSLLVALAACQQQTTPEANNDANSATATGPNQAIVEFDNTNNSKLSGVLAGAAVGTDVFVDYLGVNGNEVLKSTKTEAGGKFSFELAIPHTGMYRMRTANGAIPLILEKGCNASVSTSYPTLQDYTVSGAPLSMTLQPLVTSTRTFEPAELKTFADTTKNTLAAWFVIRLLNYQEGSNFDSYKKVRDRINKDLPGTRYATEFSQQMTAMEAQMADAIIVGKPVPDFTLPSPNGTAYTLSKLRGKIVLLDFWASWCRPCRFNNPEIVDLYNRYKDKGFTVMSVSLDRDKAAWEAAIKEDRLKWPYHVSELKMWQSAVGALYKVQSIPSTFLIDSQGKLVATNLHGPELEAALKKLIR